MLLKRASWTAGLALGLAGALAASEYRGTIRAGGLPLPAAVTAVQGDKKQTVAPDERGGFRFATSATAHGRSKWR